MSNMNNFQYTGIRLYALFALRMVIGWHFLYEGIVKLMIPGWTSADYLTVSGWIFAPFFHWIAQTPVEDVNIACEILGSDLNRERPWRG